MNAPYALKPLIVAGSVAVALQYAHQKGLRAPKVITKISDFLEYDGSPIDITQYQFFICYGGIKPEVMTRMQKMTAEARAMAAVRIRSDYL